MFRNKCAKCEKTWTKRRFIGWEGKSLGRKCYNKVKRVSPRIYNFVTQFPDVINR